MTPILGNDMFNDWIYGSPNENWYGFKVGISVNRDLIFSITAATNCSYCAVGDLELKRWQFQTARAFDKNIVNLTATSYDATFHIINNLSPHNVSSALCNTYLCN